MPRRIHAFTLVELLVVIAIIALLLAVMLPALGLARKSATRVGCATQLRQVGVAIYTYAGDYRQAIPFGPEAPAATATNFYPVTGYITSLLSLESGKPVGLGLLIGRYLSHRSDVLFCPGADQPIDAEMQLANVGHTQAQSSYWYRHGSAINRFSEINPNELRIDSLGNNTNDIPRRALVMDSNIIAPSGLAAYGVVTLTNHQALKVNVLFQDGSTSLQDNGDNRFTAEVQSNAPHLTPLRMLAAFEQADAAH